MAEAEVQEIYCKTLLNKLDIPGLPFHWTLNPYRGCRHACRYCYARPTHEFWGMNGGKDFDQRVFAKVNAPEVLRQELSRPKWRRETIAIGTASDPYEPAEAQYRLTRRILQVLAAFQNPVSITTKGILIQRDVDILAQLSRIADVKVAFSIGTMDEDIWRRIEPGTPKPMARIEAMQYLVEQGVPAGVMMAPLLPGLSDGAESIDLVVRAAAEHGAKFVSANVLFLKPGSKEWFMPLIREAYPYLMPGYEKLYHHTYAPAEYTKAVLRLVDDSRHRWGLPAKTPAQGRSDAQGQLFALAAV